MDCAQTRDFRLDLSYDFRVGDSFLRAFFVRNNGKDRAAKFFLELLVRRGLHVAPFVEFAGIVKRHRLNLQTDENSPTGIAKSTL